MSSVTPVASRSFETSEASSVNIQGTWYQRAVRVIRLAEPVALALPSTLVGLASAAYFFWNNYTLPGTVMSVVFVNGTLICIRGRHWVTEKELSEILDSMKNRIINSLTTGWKNFNEENRRLSKSTEELSGQTTKIGKLTTSFSQTFNNLGKKFGAFTNKVSLLEGIVATIEASSSESEKTNKSQSSALAAFKKAIEELMMDRKNLGKEIGLIEQLQEKWDTREKKQKENIGQISIAVDVLKKETTILERDTRDIDEEKQVLLKGAEKLELVTKQVKEMEAHHDALQKEAEQMKRKLDEEYGDLKNLLGDVTRQAQYQRFLELLNDPKKLADFEKFHQMEQNVSLKKAFDGYLESLKLKPRSYVDPENM